MTYKKSVTFFVLICFIAATVYASQGMLASNKATKSKSLPDKCSACADGPFGLCAKEDCMSQDDCGFRRVFWKYGRCYLKDTPAGHKGCDTFCFGRSVKCSNNNYQICADPDFDGCNSWIDVYDKSGQAVLCKRVGTPADCATAGGQCLARSDCQKCIGAASCGSGQCCCVEKQAPQAGCVNKCGDNSCDQNVCTGTGCPCPENSISCPRDCQSGGAVCGNNVVDTGEACDGTDLGRKACTDFANFTGGTLRCVNCQYDTGLCTGQQSGSAAEVRIVPSASAVQINSQFTVDIQLNGVQDISGLELNVQYDPARIKYDSITTGSFFDFCPVTPEVQGSIITKIACVATSPKSGSGIVVRLAFTAISGGSAAFSISSATLLDSNSQQVRVNPVPASVTIGSDNSICGNGVQEGSEQCDGSDLNGQTCQGVGQFAGGTLGCTGSCQFNTAACTSSTAAVCGNNIIESGEVCDGTSLGGKSCQAVGSQFTGGTLKCLNCAFDTSSCTQQSASQTIKLVPSVTTLNVNSQLAVQVQLNNVQNVLGLDLKVNYDAAKLRYDTMTAGSFFDFCPVTPTAQVGVITSLACVATSPKSGSGTVLTLNFVAISSGAAPISVSAPVLVNSNNQPVSGVTAGQATVTVG